MNVKMIKISDINSYKNNPRKNANAVDAVANSIKEFGFKVPIVIDKNYEIVAGHTRVLAAKKLGLTEIPCVIADDLTPEQIRAYRLADNKTHELSEWDFDLLNIELDGIFDIDMGDFGFINEPEQTEPHEDDFDIEVAMPDEPTAKRGDIWRLGRHRLMCGDSMNADDVARLMDGVKADLVVTDPPYFSFGSSSGAKSNNKDMGMVKPFFKELIKNISINLKNRHGAFVCCDWRTYPLFYEIINEYMSVRNLIVWDTEMLKMGLYFRSMHELIIYITNDNKDDKAIGAFAEQKGKLIQVRKDISNVWRIPDNNFSSSNKLHSSEKPIELCLKAIDSFIEPMEIILDLFGGSGSTLIACEQLKRTCYMMELDEKYIDVIINRLETFTGQKSELITG